MTREIERLRRTEVWMGWVRLVAVPWAVVEVGLLTEDYPSGYERWAWVATALLAAGGVLFFVLARVDLDARGRQVVGAAALAFDVGIVYAYSFLFSFELGQPTWGILYLPVLEAALRYGLLGGVGLPLATAPLLLLLEWWRAEKFAPPPFELGNASLPFGISVLTGLIVGWLVKQLGGETLVAEARAAEAEGLRDQLGRRADQLEAVNRCARALGSSLDLDQAFRAFLREVRGVLDFDRLAIVLVEGDRAEVMAAAGKYERTVFAPGTSRPVTGSVLDEVLAGGRTVVRDDMEADPRWPEERELAEIGLRARVVAPLLLGDASLGILTVVREEANSFGAEEAELITLLARQVATAVQNIRVFEAERNAAEELRRLSMLRADFVSLVSHELRAPMASVIGCAQTLRERWRELRADQRESFFALIESETSRLANLVGDVLDTSRIEAGTFPVAFGHVDVEELVREAAATISLGQDDVTLRTDIAQGLPTVRGDRERLRQLLLNLLSNAVKYTVAGDEVEVRAAAENGAVHVSVRDHGDGIPPEQQQLVFEKFGRLNRGGKSIPGAGLGLFIARSIAEAHGGSLEVVSTMGAGATFTLTLPVAQP
jgi:signal transduction histidine kinase